MEVNGQKNPKIEPKCKFFCFIDTICTKSFEAMNSNIGGSLSTCWMKKLNSRNRSKTTCMYYSEVMDMVWRMIAACTRRQVGDNSISFSSAIDSTKVVTVL